MNPLIKPTQLDLGSLAGAAAAHHLAVTLRAQWESFWSRPPETVLAELHSDITRSLTIFGLNTQLGTAVNALLDLLADERFPTRAPTAMPVGWSTDGTAFIYEPPVLQSPDLSSALESP